MQSISGPINSNRQGIALGSKPCHAGLQRYQFARIL